MNIEEKIREASHIYIGEEVFLSEDEYPVPEGTYNIVDVENDVLSFYIPIGGFFYNKDSVNIPFCEVIEGINKGYITLYKEETYEYGTRKVEIKF